MDRYELNKVKNNHRNFNEIAIDIFHKFFSKTTGILLIILFYVFMIVLGIVIQIKKDTERSKELSINNGIIIKKYDVPGNSRYSDGYYFIYENENSKGEKIQRKDRVTSVTYENFDVGDFYDSKNWLKSLAFFGINRKEITYG